MYPEICDNRWPAVVVRSPDSSRVNLGWCWCIYLFAAAAAASAVNRGVMLKLIFLL